MPSESEPTDAERYLRSSKAAHMSWAYTADRTARTAPGRAAFDAKFLDQAGGDPVRAEHLRKAHYLGLALKSAQARRKIKTLTGQAETAEAKLRVGGAG